MNDEQLLTALVDILYRLTTIEDALQEMKKDITSLKRSVLLVPLQPPNPNLHICDLDPDTQKCQATICEFRK